MIGGVSFQPGSEGQGSGQPKSSQSVQEAIQVLSLRLPKTVGARAVAPGALLNAQGSGGNPRVDSVVNQVLARFFGSSPEGGGGEGGMPQAPMVPQGMGSSFTPGAIPQSPMWEPPMTSPTATRIIPGDNDGRPPIIPEGPKPTDTTPKTQVGGSSLFPANPQLPGYDRNTGWQPPAQPMSLEQMFGGYDYEPAPPQETYSI